MIGKKFHEREIFHDQENDWVYSDNDGDELALYGFHEVSNEHDLIDNEDESIIDSLLQEYKDENGN